MELLVILLGEFLFFPFIAAAATAISAVFAFIGAIIDFLIFMPIYRNHREKGDEYLLKAHKKASPYPFRAVSTIASCVCLLLIPFIVMLNLFFFEPTVRLIAAQVAQQKGMQISFESAQGNLFTGLVELRGLTVKTENGRKADYDLRADHVLVDLDVYSLLFSPVIIEQLVVDGVSGDVESKAQPPQAQTARSEPLKPKKSFVISDMSVRNVTLKLLKGEAEPLTLTLRSIESKPFRSQYAIFDTFFRSNITGDLDGHTIQITSQDTGNGRETQWRLADFPAGVIARYVDKSPINWFVQGSLDVLVEDRWTLGDHAEIEMDWSLVLKDVRVEPPQNATILQKTVSAPIVNYINGREGPLDLSFSLLMNEDEFESTSSLGAAGLWDAAVGALARQLAERTGEKAEAVKEGVKGKAEAFKDFLDSKRKKPEEP